MINQHQMVMDTLQELFNSSALHALSLKTYTKETWLWVFGGFVMPPVVKPGDMFAEPTWVEPTEGSKTHLLPPTPDRADIRSATPAGFAAAVYDANHPLQIGRTY